MLTCDCGFEARAEREDDLVAEIRRHAREAHGMTLSCDDALVLAFRAGLHGARVDDLSDESSSDRRGGER